MTLLGFKTDGSGAADYERQFRGIQSRAAQASESMSGWAAGMVRQAKIAIGAWAGLQGVGAIVEASDNLTTTMNRLNAALPEKSEAEVAGVFDEIYRSATQTGIATDKTAQAFMRFAPAMEKLGYDASATVTMLDGIQKGMIAGGQSSAETGEVIRQLGQAITSTVFQGDELRSFMEGASATMIDSFAKDLGVTTDQLKKMGSEGKLTAKNVLPALAAAAAAGRDEFGRMQVTTSLAWARARIVITATLAEFDKIVKVSKYAGLGIQALVNGMVRFKDWLPTLRDIIDRFGGMDRVMQVVALTLGGVLAVIGWINRALLVTAARNALAWAPWIIGGLAVAAVAALVMDFVEWVGGEDVDSLFRRWFGPFAEIEGQFAPQIDALKAAWEGFKAVVGDAYRALSADGGEFWPVLLQYLRTLWETMDGVGRFMGTTLRGMVSAAVADFGEFRTIILAVRDVFASAFGTIIGWIDRVKAGWASLKAMMGGGSGDASSAGPSAPHRGTLAPWTPAPGDESFRNDMRNLLQLGMPSAPIAGEIGRGSGVNQSQSNAITNNVTVTATGTSAPEVAAGVNQGMSRATDGMVSSLREVQTAMPLVEAPAQ